MTRLEAAREIARLTALLEDALGVGDVGAADRVLQARARVLADVEMAPLSADQAAALEVLAREVRAREARVRAVLGDALAETRAGLATITTGTTLARAYLPTELATPGFVDRRD